MTNPGLLTKNKERSILPSECSFDRGRPSIVLEVDDIDFHPSISANWYISLFWMRAHKAIHDPLSPNITWALWLIAVSHVPSAKTHTSTHSWGPLFILKVKSCWGARGSSLTTWWGWHRMTHCAHVLICPKRCLTAARKAGVALNHQCISMRGSQHVCVCVCVWQEGAGNVASKAGDCNNTKHICRLDEPQPRGVCNPKPGQWLSPPPQTSTDSILIYDSNEYRFSRSSPPPIPSLFPSISPFSKRVNDVCTLISNQLFLFSFYLSLDKFSVAPEESNASLSIALCLITNWPSDCKQANNEFISRVSHVCSKMPRTQICYPTAFDTDT